jgi:hypothetical protein
MLTTPTEAVHTPRIEQSAGSLRASDADREGVAEALRGHLLAGRLSPDEFEQRIEDAYTAKTLDELRSVTRDLPAAGLPQPARRRSLPGNRPFAARFETRAPVARVMSEAMRSIAPNLLSARYQLEHSDPTRLVFRRRSSVVVVSANELGRGRTVVDVFGVASLRVRRALLELDD